ncbi:hypothetical protein QQS21_006067 [Conoideocrella luteorostrata]|uniref:N-acetyltransferase domain-containing protein n=1 Tax=Conoideocrella luteorostrata TaxID=1105319 RepID=A0AAJ0CR62_9HYPO|nr:hypothetical protein QQS21_006067 [Conoideocrella luteorostrata]
MSLPTTKPSQPSIRSFFTNTPKYAPPPSQKPPAHIAICPQSSETASPPAPPPQPRSAAPIDVAIPPQATIRPITATDIAPLRRITSLLLQVSYPDSFFQYAIANPFSRVITWTYKDESPKIIGGIVCRVEPALDNDAPTVPQNLYVRSLCLLSPYRSMGLANAALQHVLAAVHANASFNVKAVTAHVWTENEEGLRWYEGRGFTRDKEPLRGYYFKLRPDTAWLVRKEISAASNGTCNGTTISSPETREASSRTVPISTTAAVVNLPTPPSPPPPMSGTTSRPKASSGQSYQNQRPDMEWNDLPADMAPPLAALRNTGSESASATSSRSSSVAPRKKKDRSYPAAAFGN